MAVVPRLRRPYLTNLGLDDRPPVVYDDEGNPIIPPEDDLVGAPVIHPFTEPVGTEPYAPQVYSTDMSGAPSLDAPMPPAPGERPEPEYPPTPTEPLQVLPPTQTGSVGVQSASADLYGAPSVISAPRPPVGKLASNMAPERPDTVDFSSRDSYIRSAYPIAEQVAAETGLPIADLLVAIPINESGGKQVMYGIKGRSKTGQSTGRVPTWEMVNGRRVNTTAEFRSYDTPAEAMRDFVEFLQENPRYAPAMDGLKRTGDKDAFIRAVNKAGYATDPQWADKVMNIAAEVRRTGGSGGTGTKFRTLSVTPPPIVTQPPDQEPPTPPADETWTPRGRDPITLGTPVNPYRQPVELGPPRIDLEALGRGSPVERLTGYREQGVPLPTPTPETLSDPLTGLVTAAEPVLEALGTPAALTAGLTSSALSADPESQRKAVAFISAAMKRNGGGVSGLLDAALEYQRSRPMSERIITEVLLDPLNLIGLGFEREIAGAVTRAVSRGLAQGERLGTEGFARSLHALDSVSPPEAGYALDDVSKVNEDDVAHLMRNSTFRTDAEARAYLAAPERQAEEAAQLAAREEARAFLAARALEPGLTPEQFRARTTLRDALDTKSTLRDVGEPQIPSAISAENARLQNTSIGTPTERVAPEVDEALLARSGRMGYPGGVPAAEARLAELEESVARPDYEQIVRPDRRDEIQSELSRLRAYLSQAPEQTSYDLSVSGAQHARNTLLRETPLGRTALATGDTAAQESVLRQMWQRETGERVTFDNWLSDAENTLAEGRQRNVPLESLEPVAPSSITPTEHAQLLRALGKQAYEAATPEELAALVARGRHAGTSQVSERGLQYGFDAEGQPIEAVPFETEVRSELLPQAPEARQLPMGIEGDVYVPPGITAQDEEALRAARARGDRRTVDRILRKGQSQLMEEPETYTTATPEPAPRRAAAQTPADRKLAEMAEERSTLEARIALPDITAEQVDEAINSLTALYEQEEQLLTLTARRGEIMEQLAGHQAALEASPAQSLLRVVSQNDLPESITVRQYQQLAGREPLSTTASGRVSQEIYLEAAAERSGVSGLAPDEFEREAERAFRTRSRMAGLRNELREVETQLSNAAPAPEREFRPRLLARSGGLLLEQSAPNRYTVFQGEQALGRLSIERSGRNTAAVFRFKDQAGTEQKLTYLGVTPRTIKNVSLSGLMADMRGTVSARPPRSSSSSVRPITLGTGGQQQRAFASQLIETQRLHQDLRTAIERSPASYYDVVHHEEPLRLAQELIDAGPEAARDLVMGESGPIDNVSAAIGMTLISRLELAGNYAEAKAIADQLMARLTRSGQGIAVVATWDKHSPEGIFRYLIKHVQSAGGDIRLSNEQQTDLLRSVAVPRAEGIPPLDVVRQPVGKVALLREIEALFGGQGGGMRFSSAADFPPEVADDFRRRAAEIVAMPTGPERAKLQSNLLAEIQTWEPAPPLGATEETMPGVGRQAARLGGRPTEFTPPYPYDVETLPSTNAPAQPTPAAFPAGPGDQAGLLDPLTGTRTGQAAEPFAEPFPVGPAMQETLDMPRPAVSAAPEYPVGPAMQETLGLPTPPLTPAQEFPSGPAMQETLVATNLPPQPELHAFPGGPAEQAAQFGELEHLRGGPAATSAPQFSTGGTQPVLPGSPEADELAKQFAAMRKVADRVMKQYRGRNIVTNEVAKVFRDQAVLIAKMPFSEEKLWAEALMMRDLHELVPKSLSQKLNTYQAFAMIATVTNYLQNLGSNVLHLTSENLTGSLLATIDATRSFVTGAERAVLFPKIGAQLRGAAYGAKLAVREAVTGTTPFQPLTRYEVGGSRTFPTGWREAFAPGLTADERAKRLLVGMPMHYLEVAGKLAVGMPDRMIWGAAKYGKRAELAALRARQYPEAERAAKEAEFFFKPTVEEDKIANAYGLAVSFNEDTILSTIAVHAQRIGNIIGTGKPIHTFDVGNTGLKVTSKEFGAGTLMLRFARVPATLIQVGMAYSPLAIGRVAYDVLNLMGQTGRVTKTQAARRASRLLLGSGLTYGGYLASQMGLLTGAGPSESQRSLRSTEQMAGKRPQQLNLDAVYRFLVTGKKQTYQKGDDLLELQALIPLVFPVSLGATLAEHERAKLLSGEVKLRKTPKDSMWGYLDSAGQSLGDVGKMSVAAAADIMGEQSILRNLSYNLSGTDDEPLRGVVSMLTRAPATLVPGLMNQVSQWLDNAVYDVRDDDAFTESANAILARLPGLAAAYLAPRRDVTGQPMQRFDQDHADFWNIVVSPFKGREYQGGPQVDALLDIYEQTGNSAPLFSQAERTVRVTDPKTGRESAYRLTPEEQRQWQVLMGKKVNEAYGNLLANPEFVNEPPAEKAKWMNRVQTALHEVANEELRSMLEAKYGDDLALPKLEPGPPKRLDAANSAEFYEDHKLFEQYEAIPEGLRDQNTIFKSAYDQHEHLEKAAGTPEGDAALREFERSDFNWRLYSRELDVLRERARRNNPKLEKAGVRWGKWTPLAGPGPQPPKAPVAPLPPLPPRAPVGAGR